MHISPWSTSLDLEFSNLSESYLQLQKSHVTKAQPKRKDRHRIQKPTVNVQMPLSAKWKEKTLTTTTTTIVQTNTEDRGDRHLRGRGNIRINPAFKSEHLKVRWNSSPNNSQTITDQTTYPRVSTLWFLQMKLLTQEHTLSCDLRLDTRYWYWIFDIQYSQATLLTQESALFGFSDETTYPRAYSFMWF